MAKDELNVTNMFGSDDSTSILPKSEPKKLTTPDLFSGEGMAKAGSDRALAEYVGQEELDTAGLEDVVTRGRIAAADTMNEKMTEFKKAYPQGDLVFIPGTSTAEGVLEGVTNKKSGEILFRTDPSQPYAKVDANFLSKGGNEVLADFMEFFYDDIGAVSGEIIAGSKKIANLIKPFVKGVPYLGAGLTGYDLGSLLFRVGLYGFGGELAQEGIQEVRGVNEQTFKEVSDSASFKALIGMGGTAVMEPIVRRLMNVFKGKGLLKRSDESGEALDAVTEINKILEEAQIKNAQGEIIQIPALPANLLVDNPIVNRMGKQVAATSGALSGQYNKINEALAVALQSVGDEKSAAKLINLLDIATQMEKKRLFDLSYQAANGSLKFDNINSETRDFLLKQSGVDDLKNLTPADAAKIIKESMEKMVEPNGILDMNLKAASDALLKLKPNGVKLDLDKVIQLGTEVSFGTTQTKKLLDGSSDDLADMILSSFGQNRLDVVDNKIASLIDEYENPTDDLIEKITAREYKKYLTTQMGSDPLINIQQNGATLETISNALRDMDPAGGNVSLPTGAVDQAADTANISTLDFLLNARKQLADIRFGEIGNVTRDQRLKAQQLLDAIDDSIKNPANADAGWATAYEALIRLQDDQLKMMNLPIVQSLAAEGKFNQLLKGYMDPAYTADEIFMLKNTMDEKGFSAFKQGFFNQLIGDADTMMSLPERLAKYDKKVLNQIFDKPTVTALENLSGFVTKMNDAGIDKVIKTQNQFGRAIDDLITQKETAKIGQLLDYLNNYKVEVDGKTVSGWNTPLGKSFHDGIINRLFTKSTKKVKGKLTLDQSKYRAFIENLKETGIFETMSKSDQKLLDDIDLVKDFLVQAGDAGTSIEAASIAESARGLFTGRTDMGSFVGQIGEIIGLGRLFTSKAGRFFLVGEGGAQFKPASVSRVMSGVLSTIVAPDDKGVSDLAPILNILPYVEGIGKEDDIEGKKTSMMAPTPDVTITRPDPNSRLASANIANPVGMTPAPVVPATMNTDTGATGGIDMAMLDRGKQVFGPNDRIFNMAQGGILNARKPMQRVA